MAKPGAFCEAMVTRKKGKPILTRLVKVKSGAINSGITTERLTLSVAVKMCKRVQAKLQKHACQHGGRERMGDQRHETSEKPRNTAE